MRVLHCLSQRPSLTGSGITLDALVRHAAAAGWEQRVVAGVPIDDPHPEVGGLPADRIHPLVFGGDDLPFPVPGMSDAMPYPSTVFSSMDDRRIETYADAWTNHLAPLVNAFTPDVIHSHHVWLMSSLLKDLAPEIPVVTHCHATGLRQMELAPHIAPRVRQGCSRNDAFAVIQRGHVRELAEALAVTDGRIHVVGAGFRDELFYRGGRSSEVAPSLLYIGKYSASKGLPQLLDAFKRLATARPGLELHIAGDGSGPEADALRRRMTAMAPGVVLHGQIGQPELAGLMRRATVCVLPSFYEGLPLVLVEALACGCRLVATALPGVVDELAPRLGAALELVELPAMASIDTPVQAELPAFVDRLSTAIEAALSSPPPGDLAAALRDFTWEAVFERVEAVWRRLGVGV